eukprot:scaffold15589_cov111-Isochrysis_galbana.AAC.9
MATGMAHGRYTACALVEAVIAASHLVCRNVDEDGHDQNPPERLQPRRTLLQLPSAARGFV